MTANGEIDGDARLGILDRLRYIATNLGRNIRGCIGGPTLTAWPATDRVIAKARSSAASPGRLLSEGFLEERLPAPLDRRGISVLDIGGGGGPSSLLLHFPWITVPEILLRVSLRQRLPALYRLALVWALRLDRWLPLAGTMYAVFESSRGDDSPVSTSA